MTRKLLLVLAPMFGYATRGAGQQTTESTRQRMALELLSAMNARDTVALRRFVEAHFVTSGPGVPAPAVRVTRLSTIRTNLGELEFRKVDSSSANEFVALVRSPRTEEWSHFALLFEATANPRIRGLRVSPTPGPDAPTTLLSDAEIVAQLKGYVERLASRDAFSGTVMLAKAGRPLYSAAFGEANKDFGVKNTVDTKFNLGSMNKMFTAVSALQLVEKGKLSLDDTLGKYLPAGTIRPEVLSKMRIKHLLSHTSGLGSYFNDEWDRTSRARFRSVDDWMALVKPESLAFEPGTKWSYATPACWCSAR
jgi:hypothetical protein